MFWFKGFVCYMKLDENYKPELDETCSMGQRRMHYMLGLFPITLLFTAAKNIGRGCHSPSVLVM